MLRVGWGVGLGGTIDEGDMCGYVGHDSLWHLQVCDTLCMSYCSEAGRCMHAVALYDTYEMWCGIV